VLHRGPRSIVTSRPSTPRARSRGYAFDRSKLGRAGNRQRILVADGQLQYEWEWLMGKLRRRSPSDPSSPPRNCLSRGTSTFSRRPRSDRRMGTSRDAAASPAVNRTRARAH
jgi:hypothetical protein